jgi:vancomycin resistance protein VanW
VIKETLKRKVLWFIHRNQYAKTFESNPLPIKIYEHKSLIQRTLGNVDKKLQENKEHNLKLSAPKVNKILIKPGETFSFWKLVGKCTKKKGYKEGLIIRLGHVDQGIGGGMCQFTNLIQWMILHSPLTITEHHHHNQIDLFPDYGRQIPFGTGTSIMYNYLDYQFVNDTSRTFQLITYINKGYLCGELRCNKELEYSYHIIEENHYFNQEGDNYYRNNEVYREVIDRYTGNIVQKHLIVKNHSRVLYDKKYIPLNQIKDVNNLGIKLRDGERIVNK